MFIGFFLHLRKMGLPVTLPEFLVLLSALEKNVIKFTVDDFYALCRSCLVKDESHYDCFDQAFHHFIHEIEVTKQTGAKNIPESWLQRQLERYLTEEEQQQIKAMGDFEQLMAEFKQRLEEQTERHQGGNRWIGTGGTSPFGAFGYNPEDIRIGQQHSRHRRAVKVWDKRVFKDLDVNGVITSRTLKVALRKLRQFGHNQQTLKFDIDKTIHATAKNGGVLEIVESPERKNQVKVLLLFDVGGSMDEHTQVCETLFSAASDVFKTMEFFYFHNCVYESVWKENARRDCERLSTWDLIHSYAPHYKLIIVGDAHMSPYEVAMCGGSVEHWNEEDGSTWLGRLYDSFSRVVWLNPMESSYWGYAPSVGMVSDTLNKKMYPMTISGLEAAMQELSH